MQQAESHTDREVGALSTIRKWLKDQEKELIQQELALDEEKKVEDVLEFDEQTRRMTNIDTRATGAGRFVDRSNVTSPRGDP